MVLGTGIDLVHVPRFTRVVSRWGDRFLNRVFTPGEIGYCLRRSDPNPSLAARFAAKEAFFKAVSPDLPNLCWTEVEVNRDPAGRPSLRLHGRTAELLSRRRFLLSLTHDGDYAAAQVLSLDADDGSAR